MQTIGRTHMMKITLLFTILRTCLRTVLQSFSARCNYAYIFKNSTKLRSQYLIKICLTLFWCIVLIKDSSLQSVDLILNNLLPTEACVLPKSIMPIHKLHAVDQQECYTCCCPWMKTVMILFLIKG
jgi:hypothetical protein